jgi:hypothetical protein
LIELLYAFERLGVYAVFITGSFHAHFMSAILAKKVRKINFHRMFCGFRILRSRELANKLPYPSIVGGFLDGLSGS